MTLQSKSVLSTAEGLVVLQDTCGSPVFLLSSQAGSGPSELSDPSLLGFLQGHTGTCLAGLEGALDAV